MNASSHIMWRRRGGWLCGEGSTGLVSDFGLGRGRCEMEGGWLDT